MRTNGDAESYHVHLTYRGKRGACDLSVIISIFPFYYSLLVITIFYYLILLNNYFINDSSISDRMSAAAVSSSRLFFFSLSFFLAFHNHDLDAPTLNFLLTFPL